MIKYLIEVNNRELEIQVHFTRTNRRKDLALNLQEMVQREVQPVKREMLKEDLLINPNRPDRLLMSNMLR